MGKLTGIDQGPLLDLRFKGSSFTDHSESGKKNVLAATVGNFD